MTLRAIESLCLAAVFTATDHALSTRHAGRYDTTEYGVGAVPIARQYPFTAERKMMSTLVALDPSNPINGPVRLYVTGMCLGSLCCRQQFRACHVH